MKKWYWLVLVLLLAIPVLAQNYGRGGQSVDTIFASDYGPRTATTLATVLRQASNRWCTVVLDGGCWTIDQDLVVPVKIELVIARNGCLEFSGGASIEYQTVYSNQISCQTINAETVVVNHVTWNSFTTDSLDLGHLGVTNEIVLRGRGISNWMDLTQYFTSALPRQTSFASDNIDANIVTADVVDAGTVIADQMVLGGESRLTWPASATSTAPDTWTYRMVFYNTNTIPTNWLNYSSMVLSNEPWKSTNYDGSSIYSFKIPWFIFRDREPRFELSEMRAVTIGGGGMGGVGVGCGADNTSETLSWGGAGGGGGGYAEHFYLTINPTDQLTVIVGGASEKSEVRINNVAVLYATGGENGGLTNGGQGGMGYFGTINTRGGKGGNHITPIAQLTSANFGEPTGGGGAMGFIFGNGGDGGEAGVRNNSTDPTNDYSWVCGGSGGGINGNNGANVKYSNVVASASGAGSWMPANTAGYNTAWTNPPGAGISNLFASGVTNMWLTNIQAMAREQICAYYFFRNQMDMSWTNLILSTNNLINYLVGAGSEGQAVNAAIACASSNGVTAGPGGGGAGGIIRVNTTIYAHANHGGFGGGGGGGVSYRNWPSGTPSTRNVAYAGNGGIGGGGGGRPCWTNVSGVYSSARMATNGIGGNGLVILYFR